MPVTDVNLLFLLSLVATVNGFVLGWAALLGAPRTPARLFSAGSFLLAIAPITLLLTEVASPWRAFGLNIPPLLSYVCWLLGTLHFCQQRRFIPLVAIASLPFVLLVLWLNFQTGLRDERIFVVVLALALLRLATAWVLVRHHGDLDRRVARVFAGVMLIEVMAFGLRGFTVLSGDMPSIGADDQSTTTATWVAVLLAAVLSTPLLMLLGLGRLISDLRHTSSRLRATLDALPEMVFELDKDGCFTAIHAHQPMPFLSDPESALAKRADQLLPATMSATIEQMMHRLKHDGQVLGVQFDLETAEGPRRFDLSAAQRPAATEQDSSGYVFVVRDISESSRIERLKREFVSVVSHELRTPLTSIAGAIDLLANLPAGSESEQGRQLLAIARSNSQRLRFLIDDLLDIEKLAAGKMRFELSTQQLAPLLHASIAANETYGSARQVRLQLQEPLPVLQVNVDVQRFAQVLSNLISNAVKFSPAGGAVEITVEHDDSDVLVRVRDHGPSVPPNFQEQLFQPFSQADGSDSRRQHGSGLGLAIARGMLEQMRGTVTYQDAAGGGACFCIRLPLVSTPSA